VGLDFNLVLLFAVPFSRDLYLFSFSRWPVSARFSKDVPSFFVGHAATFKTRSNCALPFRSFFVSSSFFSFLFKKAVLVLIFLSITQPGNPPLVIFSD